MVRVWYGCRSARLGLKYSSIKLHTNYTINYFYLYSMWQRILNILQNILESKQVPGIEDYIKLEQPNKYLTSKRYIAGCRNTKSMQVYYRCVWTLIKSKIYCESEQLRHCLDSKGFRFWYCSISFLFDKYCLIID
jgi:hypothetical protein